MTDFVTPGRQGLYARYFKRLLDVLLSGAALTVLSPLLLIVAGLVRVKLGSPVIFGPAKMSGSLSCINSAP